YNGRVRDMELGARAYGLGFQSVAARKPADFQAAFDDAKQRADALVVLPDALFHSYPARFAELAARRKLPAIYDRTDFVNAGGLMSYGVSLADLSRQSAWYVDQILKGSKPSQLPVVSRCARNS